MNREHTRRLGYRVSFPDGFVVHLLDCTAAKAIQRAVSLLNERGNTYPFSRVHAKRWPEGDDRPDDFLTLTRGVAER